MASAADLLRLITDAAGNDDASKLPAALVSSGSFLIKSAFKLIISKRPGDVIVTGHGSAAAAYTYYAVLGGTAAFSLAEAMFGLLVLPRDLRRWSLTAKALLSVSLVPLAAVQALGRAA